MNSEQKTRSRSCFFMELIFNLLVFMGLFNSVRLIGNYAITNGIGTSNKSLGAIIMFSALLIGYRKYVSEDTE